MDEDTLFDHDWDDKHIIDIEWDNPNHEELETKIDKASRRSVWDYISYRFQLLKQRNDDA